MKEKIAKAPKNLKPLNPREAFFGGRTNGVRLFYQVCEEVQIKYVDFCSLYPYTNKYCAYPIGHPTVFTTDLSNDVFGYFGWVVRFTVLPPQHLFHPVLPIKIHDKLMFPLCRRCVVGKSCSRCTHTDSERALTGTWVTIEVQKAVELGYKILNVEIVWHFENNSVR